MKALAKPLLLEPSVEPDLRVGFVLTPEFTLLALAGFIESLRHAADEVDRSRQIYCQWSCLGADNTPIRASCGMEFLPWKRYGDVNEFDYIVVVGGLLAAKQQWSMTMLNYLREAAHHNVPLVGFCTGSFVLAEAGLMNDKRCAVHIQHYQEFRDCYPQAVPITDEIYVFDGHCITCAGGTAAIDLATELLIRHCGKARALKALRQMLVDKHRAAHYVPNHPDEDVFNCGDGRVEQAVKLMEESISVPLMQ